mgnify:CR=1 FL=1
MNSPAFPPLAWLSTILWPDEDAHFVTADVAGDRVDASTTWWASPNADEPRILVPVAPAPSRTAVRRYHDGQRGRDRLRSLAAEAIVRTKPLARRALDSNRVVVSGPSDAGLLETLRQELGVDELHAAISLAQPKSNRKPVLQLIDSRGQCLGYAKVGWNAHTTDLVRNEAGWLTDRPSPPVIAPEVLHVLELGAQTVVVTSPVTGSRWPRRRRFTCPIDVVRAVAAMRGRRAVPVSSLAWTTGVLDVLDSASPTERSIVGAAIEQVGSEVLEAGAWHGDLTPWNLLTSSRGVGLIDWEFAAADVPVGFDVCHFHTQVGMELCGLDAPAALARAAPLAAGDLARLEQRGATANTVWRLYLVELARRTFALRSRGFDTTAVYQGPAALALLSAATTVRPGSLRGDHR